MNVPLKALSWAIRFFWIIALAFGASCAYSATLIRLNFGQPQYIVTEKDFTITLPIVFDNKGYYEIADLQIQTLVLDNESRQIAETTTQWKQVLPENNATIFHNATFSLDKILSLEDYLLNDRDFHFHGSVHFMYADLFPFGFESNRTIPWGAPLSNFTAGIPGFGAYNATHMRVTESINFRNNSPYFGVVGRAKIDIFNQRGELMGTGSVSVAAPSNTSFEDVIDTLVDMSMMTGRGEIHVYVETDMFNYGPLVVNYGQ